MPKTKDKQYKNWISQCWPLQSEYDLQRFKRFIDSLRFHFNFNYHDTFLFVQEAVGRQITMGDFDTVMAELDALESR